MEKKAPIVLFVFKRLETVKMILDVIRKYEPDCIYVFSDGPRKNYIGESEAVQSVRDYLSSSIDWECEKYLYYSDYNKGCDKNIRDGLDDVFSKQENAIVFEDDAVPTMSFFSFCNELLTRYKDDERIQYIAGFNALGDLELIKDGYTFGKTVPMNGAFATWNNRWIECDFDMKQWPDNKKNKLLDNIFYYKELRKQYYKIYDEEYLRIMTAWDYQFEHDMLSKDRLAIVPKYNLVTSYGFTEGAFHPQKKGESLRFKKMMTANNNQEVLGLDFKPIVSRNDVYDKARQKRLLEIKGNWFERRCIYAYRSVKDFLYNNLSEQTWNTIKRIVIHGKG